VERRCYSLLVIVETVENGRMIREFDIAGCASSISFGFVITACVGQLCLTTSDISDKSRPTSIIARIDQTD